MPITIRPSPDKVGNNSDPTQRLAGVLRGAADLLSWTWNEDTTSEYAIYTPSLLSWMSRGILHSMLNISSTDYKSEKFLIPYDNGFVEGVLRAFQQDLHLVLRPDDVWLAILTQFSLYLKAHADEHRSKVVNHNATETLVIEDWAKTDPYWKFAEKFVPLMKQKMASPEVYDWLIPRFTTTTQQDAVVSSMVMMATMRPYTSFGMENGCGFPSVTLLGEVNDWRMILARLDKFSEYGEEPTAWSKLLKLVLNRMIASMIAMFDSPELPELKEFWMRVCRCSTAASPNLGTFNGWLTAFMYWGKDGKRTNTADIGADGANAFELEDVRFPIVVKDEQLLQTGMAEVPVTINDYENNMIFDTRIVAGLIGMWVKHEKKGAEWLKYGTGSTVQPCSGWFLVVDEAQKMGPDDDVFSYV